MTPSKARNTLFLVSVISSVLAITTIVTSLVTFRQKEQIDNYKNINSHMDQIISIENPSLYQENSTLIENEDETLGRVSLLVGKLSQAKTLAEAHKIADEAKKIQTSKKHLNNGRKSITEHDYKSAIEKFDKALQLDKRNKWILLELAHAHFKQIETENSTDINHRLHKPIKYLREAEKLNEADNSDTFGGAVFYNWGLVRELQYKVSNQEKFRKKAIRAYKKSIELRPRNRIALNKLASLAERLPADQWGTTAQADKAEKAQADKKQ